MQPVELKFLTAGDEALLVSAVNLTDEGPITRTQATQHLSDSTLTNIVGIIDNKVVGFIYGYTLRRFEAVSFFIYSVDVDDDYQRRGVGFGMLEALAEFGRGGAWDEMFVFTNEDNDPAMRLYSKASGKRPNKDDVMFDFELG